MSIERARSHSISARTNHVTVRLCAVGVFCVGILCVFGGYLLGRMARIEVKRSNDIMSFNLTVAADNLYKKAKGISPKAVHHNDPEKINSRILEIFQCNPNDCKNINPYNLAELIKISVNFEINKLLKSLYDASVYIDSLR